MSTHKSFVHFCHLKKFNYLGKKINWFSESDCLTWLINPFGCIGFQSILPSHQTTFFTGVWQVAGTRADLHILTWTPVRKPFLHFLRINHFFPRTQLSGNFPGTPLLVWVSSLCGLCFPQGLTPNSWCMFGISLNKCYSVSFSTVF